MTDWHWYDTVIFIICWSLPGLCIAARALQESNWRKKFGERKAK